MTQVADAAGKLADVTDAHLVVLRKIGQPGGKDGTATRGELADLTAMSAAARRLQTAAKADDGAGVANAGAAVQTSGTAADDHARAFGFLNCGKGQRDAGALVASATPVVLKEELITKADRICARAQTDLGNITGSEDQSLPGLVRTLDTGIPLIERAVADIRA